jgi:hypothetical protein
VCVSKVAAMDGRLLRDPKTTSPPPLLSFYEWIDWGARGAGEAAVPETEHLGRSPQQIASLARCNQPQRLAPVTLRPSPTVSQIESPSTRGGLLLSTLRTLSTELAMLVSGEAMSTDEHCEPAEWRLWGSGQGPTPCPQ